MKLKLLVVEDHPGMRARVVARICLESSDGQLCILTIVTAIAEQTGVTYIPGGHI